MTVPLTFRVATLQLGAALLCSAPTNIHAETAPQSTPSPVAHALPLPSAQVPASRSIAWSLQASGGIQALGFAPVPANSQAAVGGELGLLHKNYYQLRLGSDLGFYSQVEFANAISLDFSLINRFTSKWGLYADLELILGSELAWVNTTTYQPGSDGRLQKSTAPLLPHARFGLGSAIGYDLRQQLQLPLRIFVRYRQLAMAPFMAGNNVPFMGLASLSAGIAVEMN